MWLVPTTYGGLVLEQSPHREPTAHHLPNLTTSHLEGLHNRLHPPTDPDATGERRRDRGRVLRGDPTGTGGPTDDAVTYVVAALTGLLDNVGLTDPAAATVLIPVGVLAVLPTQAAAPHLRLAHSAALANYAHHHLHHQQRGVFHLDGRVTAVTNPDGTLPGAQAEGDHLQATYDAAHHPRSDATWANLQTADPTTLVLHLAAHGSPDPSLHLADRAIHPHDLTHIVPLLNNLRLLFANCCSSGTLTPGAYDQALGFTTTATIHRTPATLTALWPIDDTTANTFTTAYYHHLNTHHDPHQALTHARTTPPNPTTTHAYQLTGW